MPTDMKTLVEQAKQEITEIPPDRAEEHREAGHVIVDVREPHEYEQGRIPGAINIPRGVLEIKVPGHEAIPDTDTPICVYCGSGGRAALSAQRLQELGYRQVTSIEGGIKGWTGSGLPTETVGHPDEEE